MDWQSMVAREPELADVERSIVQARQAGATFGDWWREHHVQLSRLVGFVARCPGLRNERAFKVAHKHLIHAWITAMGKPLTGPWDSRPMVMPAEVTS